MFQSTRPRGARLLAGVKQLSLVVSIHAPTRGATPVAGVAGVPTTVSIHAPTRGATKPTTATQPLFCFNPRAHAGRDNRKPKYFLACISFNPRAHAGRDVILLTFAVIPAVSIHAPTRGATAAELMASYRSPVSIHAPTRGATPAGLSVRLCRNVSIHAPTRGATSTGITAPLLPAFQSTRPRGARPSQLSSSGSAGCFNPRAHAGRDLVSASIITSPDVSIHAPTRGATPTLRQVSKPICFNPRAHAGRDLLWVLRRAKEIVSIHAPTRGATRPHSSRRCASCFNPRAHAGRDLLLSVLQHWCLFQSTRPRGARRWRRYTAQTSSCFNPRAHAGRDFHHCNSATDYLVSIHAPTRGATMQAACYRARSLFQSTRPRGARPASIPGPRLPPVSIHAPTRGATISSHRTINNTGFNPRAHAGRDLIASA